MELSTFTLRVVLLFFPGMLCALLVDSLTAHRERTPAQFLTSAFILGIGSYLLLYIGQAIGAGGAGLLGLPSPPNVSFFDTLLDDRKSLAAGEIGLTGIIAILLGGILSAAINHKIVHRAAQRLKISRAFGDLDVWGLMFNSPETTWVTVRDQEHQLTYFGWVEAFSDTCDKAEILLGQVEVFSATTGGKLYRADRVYLARPADALIIEPLASGNRPSR